MQHTANAQLVQGSNELIIENISNKIDINSIQVNCPAAVTIMGVEFSNNYLVLPAGNTRIQLLKDSSESVRKKLKKQYPDHYAHRSCCLVLKANNDIKEGSNVD